MYVINCPFYLLHRIQNQYLCNCTKVCQVIKQPEVVVTSHYGTRAIFFQKRPLTLSVMACQGALGHF